MQKGDISNVIPARMLIVFDGLVAQVPLDKQRTYGFCVKARRWKQAERLFEYDATILALMKDIGWRWGIRLDVATFECEDMAEMIAWRFDHINVSVSSVLHYDTPVALGRAMAYMPEVTQVVHAHPNVQYAVGSKAYDVRALGVGGVIF